MAFGTKEVSLRRLMGHAVVHSHASRPASRSRVRRIVVASAAALATLGLSASSARAIYIRSDKSVSSYNTLTNKPAFNPVGYIGDTDFDFAFSSGTLISPTKVLTAAHIVDDNGDLKVDD